MIPTIVAQPLANLIENFWPVALIGAGFFLLKRSREEGRASRGAAPLDLDAPLGDFSEFDVDRMETEQ